MTQNKRIVLNTMATYGRSLVSICLGLFTARWVLESLGQQDMGLYGVVGGLIFFVTFINATLSGCVARFYAYSIGHGRNLDAADAADDLNWWFNTALSVHVLLPIVMLLVGYPVGLYAIRHWLVIPPDRMSACMVVFHISLLTSTVSMISVPYIAMYTARQLIAELALFELFRTFSTFICSYMLLSVTGDRLIWYAVMMMLISISIAFVQIFRVRMHFETCRISLPKMYNLERLRRLFSYSGWQIVGGAGYVIRNQGVACLVNIMYGPKFNASYSIGNQLAMHTSTLSYALANAISPAMTTEEGAGNREAMLRLARLCSKFGALLVLFFGLPLMDEMDNLLVLWLKNPPADVASICMAMVIVLFIFQFSMGPMLAIHANGNIRGWQIFDAIGMMIVLPVAYGLAKLTGQFSSVGVAFIIAGIVGAAGKLWYARKLVGMPCRSFLVDVMPRMVLMSSVTLLAGYAFSHFFEPTFFRLIGTGVVTSGVTFSLGWVFVMSRDEREYLISKFSAALKRKF